VELKLEIDPAAAEKLRSLRLFEGQPRIERLISVYYDTPKRKLRQKGLVLRVRQHDEGWVQTVKRAGDSAGLFDRDEWEVPVQGLEPDFQAIANSPLKELIKPRQFRHLIPVFRTDVERMAWDADEAGKKIELTYDAGTIEAGVMSEPIHELELELKEGEVGALFSAAREIGRQIPVRLGVQSKSERGFALAQRKTIAPVKATTVELPEAATVADGFAAIVTACLKHFRVNEPLLVRTRDAEALHQLRVAVRRLRTALWLFRPAVKGSQFSRIDVQLRSFTRELGAARNIDVILASMTANDPARSQLEKDRTQLYRKILRKLNTARFRALILDILCWAHAGDWRLDGKADRLLLPFARKRLDRLWGRIRERGGELSELTEIQQHHLRIDTKKIRYALEFLGDPRIKANEEQRKFIAASEGVQDSLGHLNDLATRRAMLSWPMQPLEKDAGRALRAAKRHLREMEKIGPYWSED
jgi:inorganic triphosphatase YgiF